METFEEFARNNVTFDNGNYYIFSGNRRNAEMLENYEIAKRTVERYEQCYGSIEGPKIGDVVEFSDGFEVFKHAIICEDCFGESKHGLLYVCEHGKSWTNGKGFSTSGGAFRHIHKSLMLPKGRDKNMVWTWGCNGAGANQGIYFSLDVNRWLVPYEPIESRSNVTIYYEKEQAEQYGKIAIRNVLDWYTAQSFESVKAFKAWAEYVGYKYANKKGTYFKTSPQTIKREYVSCKNEIPKGAKPLKLIDNGELTDAWAFTTDESVTYYINYSQRNYHPKYGTPEYEAYHKEYRKYANNPLGV